jgi:hypothetical protein
MWFALSSPEVPPILSCEYKKKSTERQTGVTCTREPTVPKGDEKKRIKSSLSARYLRKEIYIS